MSTNKHDRTGKAVGLAAVLIAYGVQYVVEPAILKLAGCESRAPCLQGVR